ncbi:MAG: hypothetical protein QG575_255 [Euryarchaeota archaeon]|nr:hypothetical protein [Euryarchaeota archaeon]
MSHYPNPFDFVPFPSAPILRTEKQFDALGEKFSGYLELEIKALAPVHVVGSVEGDASENRSFFFRQNDQPCIPASSIRGCLRAFTEALTAGWVSQAQPPEMYQKVYGRARGMRNKGRHIGFCTLKDKNDHGLPSAVNIAFKPELSDAKLDVASYLFGIVTEGKQTENKEQARKSKIWIEDAYLDPTSTSKEDYWIPDIKIGNAFMGGAKPSASNWWYFKPAKIWKRNLSGTAPVAEFVGENFRGRKFYFHQNPVKCIQKYDPKNGEWSYPENKSHQSTFHPIGLECMGPGKTTLRFRIYLDGVPRPLFSLLINILLPGEHIRHKLGYAKAYGYGSIEFILKSAKLRTFGLGIPNALELQDVPGGNWDNKTLAKYGIADFIDPEALVWLARILGWPPEDLLFMYPQYKEHEFKQPIQYSNFMHMTKIKMHASGMMKIKSTEQAQDIAEDLWSLKRPIDFRLYQEKANNWDIIEQRRP